MAFDPDAFLAKEEKKEAEPEKEKGFDPDAFLAKEDAKEQAQAVEAETKATGPVAPSEGAVLGAVAPAVTGYSMGPTGMKELGQAVKAGVSPYMTGVKEGLGKTMDVYRARPIMAPLIDAVGVATMGVPPIAGGQQALGAYEKFNAAKQGAQAAGQVLSQGAPATTPVMGLPSTATKGPYMDMVRSASPEIGTKISELYGAQTGGGGNNAVRSWLNSAEGKAAQAANPQFAQLAQQYLKTVPTYGQQAMKVVSPLLKGAARVAGPVGMAANLYEASPYLAEAGPEASSGRAQNRMAEAQRMMLSRPTPQPLSPQEASNLLASDDQRTINIYGGRANLEALVRSGIKQRAASKVLGPIAPGQ
jgi:hypothetical protein